MRGLRLPARAACTFGVLIIGMAPINLVHAHRHHPHSHRHRHHHRNRHHHRHRGHRASAGCQNATSRATTLSLDQVRAAVVCLINYERTDRGLPTLRESAKLDRSAQSWSDHMVATSDFTHGTAFSARISAVGYDWQMAGENIAAGQPTPRAVVDAWMASTGHCQNILDPEFRDIGVGMNPSPVSGGIGPITWTTDFGLAMSESPDSHDMGPANGCPYH